MAAAAVAPCPNGGVVGAGAAVTSSETTRQRHVQISEDDEKRREGLVAKWEGKVSSDYKIVVSAHAVWFQWDDIKIWWTFGVSVCWNVCLGVQIRMIWISQIYFTLSQ